MEKIIKVDFSTYPYENKVGHVLNAEVLEISDNIISELEDELYELNDLLKSVYAEISLLNSAKDKDLINKKYDEVELIINKMNELQTRIDYVKENKFDKK